MKTSQTTPRVAAAIAGMALFLGAAAAAGIERGKDMVGSGKWCPRRKLFGRLIS